MTKKNRCGFLFGPSCTSIDATLTCQVKRCSSDNKQTYV